MLKIYNNVELNLFFVILYEISMPNEFYDKREKNYIENNRIYEEFLNCITVIYCL